VAVAELSTVNHIVDFDVNYQLFTIIDCAMFHEDDEAFLVSIEQDCNDKATREAAGVAAAVAAERLL
jgi:hypothetical protein